MYNGLFFTQIFPKIDDWPINRKLLLISAMFFSVYLHLNLSVWQFDEVQYIFGYLGNIILFYFVLSSFCALMNTYPSESTSSSEPSEYI